jgi:hypothetical protein
LLNPFLRGPFGPPFFCVWILEDLIFLHKVIHTIILGWFRGYFMAQRPPRDPFVGSGRPQEGGFLATHKQDFNAHISGTAYRHCAEDIDMSPVLGGCAAGATVQEVLTNLVSCIGDPEGVTVLAVVITTPTTIVGAALPAHRIVPVNTSASGTNGPATINLPLLPLGGETITIKDWGRVSSTNQITIGRNGSNIDNVAANDVLADNRGSISYTWSVALSSWISY